MSLDGLGKLIRPPSRNDLLVPEQRSDWPFTRMAVGIALFVNAMGWVIVCTIWLLYPWRR